MDKNWVYHQLAQSGLSQEHAYAFSLAIMIGVVVAATFLATVVIRKFILGFTAGWLQKNKYRWDDALVDNRVISKISWFIPIITAHLLLDVLLPADSSAYLFIKRFLKVAVVLITVLSINALLSAVNDICRLMKTRRADVFQGFTDAGKIVMYIIGVIFMVSILSGVTPWGIVSVLGGLTAVTMLVFKDTILGFVASVQLTMMDMVRVGDWVEMPPYGADGDVVSISIHTIRVQNWDKTITTIPTYSLVSNSFKNWRGMTESGGRRIKRALMVDISSIKFCDDTLMAELGKIHLLKGYLRSKHIEIGEYNKALGLADGENSPINGRRQTNIGVFRAYLIAYLKSIPAINLDMTFLVRQLAPTENGLPLEIYVFSRDKRWFHYEALQSDIFDHLFAALPLFDLRAFQNPSGYDMRMMTAVSGKMGAQG